MEWILDNLQLVFVVIIIIVYALRGFRRRPQADEEDGQIEPEDTASGDPGEAERTRRIQEEIRRRILARQRGEDPERAGPVIVFEDEGEPTREVYQEPPERAPAPQPPPIPRAPQPDFAMSAMLERQRALDDQFRAIQASRAAATAGIPSIGALARPVASGPRGTGRLRRELRRDLVGVRSLRKAVLLREVLGEPPGMRAGMPQLPRR
jgi:hypothetical protein